MRIGIDAHIILPQHKRYDPKIAKFTDQLITNLLEADKKKEHTWVLFFDERMKGSKKLDKYKKENVEIKHFPFIHYRQYLPVFYSHILISSFLATAGLDAFHSPEGLIPFLYPGKIVTTFHYVPRGESESNLFVRTFMLGARVAFARLCKRAKKIIVSNDEDKKRLIEKHSCSNDQVVVISASESKWPGYVNEMLKVYESTAVVKIKNSDQKPKKSARPDKKKK